MPTVFPEPTALGLLPTHQARDMVIPDLDSLLKGPIKMMGRARFYAPIWAARLFEVQPVMNNGAGHPFANYKDQPQATKIAPKAKAFMAQGYWTRRNIKQSWACSDFPEAVELKTRNIYFA